MKVSIIWFRRDLRIEDNTALINALNSEFPVLPLFIFDSNILRELPRNDARINFIYKSLQNINQELAKYNSSIFIKKGDPIDIWSELLIKFDIAKVYINKDYEPYAIQRDDKIFDILKNNDIELKRYKDQVIFEEVEILKDNASPYSIYTPYKNKWLKLFKTELLNNAICSKPTNFLKQNFAFPSLDEIGFTESQVKVRKFDLSRIIEYSNNRDIPFLDATSYLGPHLRFGTVSIRKILQLTFETNQTFISELIWREFFMQIIYHYPKIVKSNFKSKYDGLKWRNRKNEFEWWCNGNTGYPIVDAGMRQLNSTGYMHNRVRMITAGFLCKHLLIDWRWGESYFAKKLLDYELSSNNGNWQWAAGTGCDAAPYFRIFNPQTQLEKFDKRLE